MSLAGLGAVAIWHDLLPAGRDDFHEWHNREHMPERVAIPGFRRGRRYIAVDATGNAYITGETNSTAATFPETVGAYDIVKSGGRDAFVAKLNPTGSALRT